MCESCWGRFGRGSVDVCPQKISIIRKIYQEYDGHPMIFGSEKLQEIELRKSLIETLD